MLSTYPITQFQVNSTIQTEITEGGMIPPPPAIPRSPACLKLKIIGSVRSQLLIKLPCLRKKKHLPFQHIQSIQTLESVTFRILDLKNKFSSELLTVPNTNEIA